MTTTAPKFVPAAQRISHEIRKELADKQDEIIELTKQLRVAAIQRIQLEMALVAINEPNAIITGNTPQIEHEARGSVEDEASRDDETARIASIVGRGK